jgi:hypothetical protein
MSRRETFERYAEEHPGEVIAAQEEAVAREIEGREREERRARGPVKARRRRPLHDDADERAALQATGTDNHHGGLVAGVPF